MKNIYWRNFPVGELQKSGVKLAEFASFIIRFFKGFASFRFVAPPLRNAKGKAPPTRSVCLPFGNASRT
jgi:hypothetical protein